MNMQRSPTQRARGVSLVEALVAVAAMGIGMFGIVGLQATLRSNSDIAKQRSEAVRFAQEEIEKWRAITAMGVTANRLSYTDLGPGTTTETIPDPSSVLNATYERERTVTYMHAGGAEPDDERDPVPRAKSVRVNVSWVDRSGESQSVTLSTAIAGVMPELAATLAVPADGDPVRQPFGRNRAIPVPAKLLNEQYSGFKPPGAPPTVAWRFDNVTALITLCTTDAGLTNDTLTLASLSCGTDNAMLLSGYVRYSTAAAQPGSEEPTSDPLALEVWVDRTAPSALRYACHVQNVTTPSKYTAYHCAVPVVVQAPPTPTTWSGRTYFKPDSLFPTYKVCRYFGDGGFATGGTYTAVSGPIVNQNFLVIRAAYDCPNPPTVSTAHQSLLYPGP